MSCLVIAELENGTPNRPSLAAISASLELESTIDLLVFNPDKYDIQLPEIPNKPIVQKISIGGQVEVLTLSEFLDIKPELLYKLNAGYTKWASAPKDQSIFYIPVEKYYLFESLENPFRDVNQINWISHIVESGDSLWALANKYDTEVKIIKEINEARNKNWY